MPIVTVTLIEGYPAETKTALSERLTDAVLHSMDAPLEAVTVVLNEVPGDNYMRGRRRRTPGAPTPAGGPASHATAAPPADPAETVRAFLDTMAARDLTAAERFLAPGFTMVFPGATRLTRLADLVAFGGRYYTHIGKTYDRFDRAPGPDGATIVWVTGTLHGTWTDGAAFSGIRYVDRFSVKDGLLLDQEVWNDLEIAARAHFG